MQPKAFNFPQHQGAVFLGVRNFAVTTKYTPEYSRKRAPLVKGVGVFFLFWVFYIPKNVIFQGSVGGAILTSHFWGRHSRALEIHVVELSPILSNKKKWRNTGQKPSPEHHREFLLLWNPPTRLKNRAGNDSPRNHTGRCFFRILWKTKFRQIFTVFSAQWMVDFDLILARFCDAFRVTIRNLLDFSMEVSISFPGCILFP